MLKSFSTIRLVSATVLAGAIGLLMVGCASDTPVAPDSPPAFRHVAGVVTAHANLHPMNKSGIRGTINFTDDGAARTHDGVARGLDPSALYVSLVYDNVTSGGPDAGPNKVEACEPVMEFEGMFLGIWIVDANGHGTLLQLGPRAPISAFRTVSIRDTRINDGFGPDAIVACGQVADHPAG